MTEILALWHPAMLKHKPPAGAFKFPSPDFLAVDEPHPERPERLMNIKAVIADVLSDKARLIEVGPATRDELESIHSPKYINWVESFSDKGGGRIAETTTGGNSATFNAARYASGAAITALETAVETGSHTIPYAMVRPPGHHAQPTQADGFCFFNHTAIATEQLLIQSDVESIAIVDWDVHHGNGTQEIFYNRADVLPISIHTDHGPWHPEFHPQTGSLEEEGDGDGDGYNVNIPVPPAIGNDGYNRVLDEIVEPIISEYQPDCIIVGAGQDAGIADPNARNMLDRVGFRRMGENVRSYAQSYSDGNLAVIQEGGYQLSHLPIATLGVFEGLLGTKFDLPEHGTEGDPFTWLEEESGPTDEWIKKAKSYHSMHWSL